LVIDAAVRTSAAPAVRQDGRLPFPARLAALQAYLEARSLDALVVSTPINIKYLCGFAGTAGLLLVTTADRFLLVDGRYDLAVREALAEGRIGPVAVEVVDRRYDLTIAATAAREQLKRVGFEANHLTVANLEAWRRGSPAIDWISTQGVVEGQRVVKDGAELETLRRGAQMLDRVASDLRAILARGMSEHEVAAGIDSALGAVGFERLAFTTIVASGPNSALPHARPTARRLDEGDLVLLDFGGVLDGYCVDLTRMAVVGSPSAPAMALYEAVREANVSAVRAVRPGVPASDIDQAARAVLEARNLGEAFRHATGHGLGLEVHEAPRLARPDADLRERLETGMVFTIEPGAYVEGIGGVRLEDDVLVTPEGCEVLTKVPHDLLRV
jgi:Xaa-Pro aminopeptidase